MVEHNLAKVRVAGPSPVFRSKFKRFEKSNLFFVYDGYVVWLTSKVGSPAKSGG